LGACWDWGGEGGWDADWGLASDSDYLPRAPSSLLASADEDSVDAVDWEKLREEDADSSWWFTAATTTTTKQQAYQWWSMQ
jgi:hypothetical protein